MGKAPNVVYILADDMGYGDVSCLNGESKIRTTNIDTMAAQGMRFTDAHASSSVCTPSRYAILTGRYNWRSSRKDGVTFGYSLPLIEPGRMTVASFLRDQGYATGCVGKWHLGWQWQLRDDCANPDAAREEAEPEAVDFSKPITGGPTDYGFDYYFGISASLDMPPYVYVENDRVTAIPDGHVEASGGKTMWRAGAIAPDFRHEDVLPTLTEKAVAWIDERCRGDEPFFLYFPLPAPHTPILPTKQFQGTSGTNAYGDFCLQVDDVVGQVMAALDRGCAARNTVFVFTTDNGCSPSADFDELAAVGHHPSYHFRGHKADIYDGGHRIPLIVRWPDGIAPDTRCDETVCLVDLLATCAEIHGQALPDCAGEDSISNLPLWKGRPGGTREATVHHSINGSFSIRRGKWKLEMCPGSGGWSAPKPGEEPADSPPVQLYDMEADVGETTNLQGEYPEIVAELTVLLTRYVRDGRSTSGAPQPNTGPAWWPQLNWMDGPGDANT